MLRDEVLKKKKTVNHNFSQEEGGEAHLNWITVAPMLPPVCLSITSAQPDWKWHRSFLRPPSHRPFVVRFKQKSGAVSLSARVFIPTEQPHSGRESLSAISVDVNPWAPLTAIACDAFSAPTKVSNRIKYWTILASASQSSFGIKT